MAASSLNKPGAKHGPCSEPCEHLDYAALRETAACVCRFCDQPIRYERLYYDEWYDQPVELKQNKGRYAFFVHAECLYESFKG